MAKVILGLGTSHSPQLSTPAERWGEFENRDRRNPWLIDLTGKPTTYEKLLEQAPPSIAGEITPEKFKARDEANQKGMAKLTEVLEQATPDVLLMFGNDQRQAYQDDNFPALLVYWGEAYRDLPRDAGEAKEFPVASALGKHLIEFLTEREFDIAGSEHQNEGQPMTSAFSFVHRRIMTGKPVPMVPFHINTYFPPNQPTPKRCYDLGQAVRKAIEAWGSSARVAVLASGGLSHFVVDEEVDRQTLKALQDKDRDTLINLPRERLNAGTSEIRNWIATAGAVEDLDMHLVDYVPCYRSPAGTGCAMAFAYWK